MLPLFFYLHKLILESGWPDRSIVIIIRINFHISMLYFSFSVQMNAWEAVPFETFNRQSRVTINVQKDLEDMLHKLDRPQGNNRIHELSLNDITEISPYKLPQICT